VAGGDSNQGKIRDYRRRTMCGFRGQISVASKALNMMFLVYAAALACVTRL
jgi:hypothetical protein